MNIVKPINFLTNYGDLMSADQIQNSDAIDDEDRPATEALLRQIARYRLLTFTTMAQMAEFSGWSPRHLRRLLRDCRVAGLLSSATLHSGIRYWFLTPDGAARCGLEKSRSGPLSEPAKLRAYAMLMFCCGANRPRYRLAANELKELLPSLHRNRMPGTYYFDPAGIGTLGLARIDAGHHGRWDRIIQSVKDDIAQHTQMPGFQQFIAAHRFEITVITVLPAKAERTARVLNSLPEMKLVPLHVVAQPELLPLIGSIAL